MRDFLQAWLDAFRERRLLTYATAIAMRGLIGMFLVGAQLDEFRRQDAKGDSPVGVHELAKRLF